MEMIVQKKKNGSQHKKKPQAIIQKMQVIDKNASYPQKKNSKSTNNKKKM